MSGNANDLQVLTGLLFRQRRVALCIDSEHTIKVATTLVSLQLYYT